MKRIKYQHKPVELFEGEPFDHPDDAWFWSFLCQQNCLDGAKILAGNAMTKRPCDPRDVMVQISKLYRLGRLHKNHLKVLKEFGQRQIMPDCRLRKQQKQAQLWQQAMDELGSVLYSKGIVNKPDSAININ